MTTLAKIGIAAGAVAIAVAIVPALKGPYNRLKNTANEKLNDEFLVDNYKAEYVNLYQKKAEVKKNLEKFSLEKRFNEKKIEQTAKLVAASKAKLVKTGTADLAAFNRVKDEYETNLAEYKNLVTLSGVYSNAIAKLETSYALIETNMRKAKANVDTLASKKLVVDSIKGVNKTIENLNGVGDSDLGLSLERLDDAALHESLKLEVIAEDGAQKSAMSEAEAKAYLDSLK